MIVSVISMSNNNASLIAIGLAAIMMIGALTGALIVVVSSDNNTSNVHYAPETPNALWEYANNLCKSDKISLSDDGADSSDETVLYQSLLNQSFKTNGKTMKITSVESFRNYLTSLGYYVYEDTNTVNNDYSLWEYTLSLDDVNVDFSLACFMHNGYYNPFLIESMTARSFASNTFGRIAPEFKNIDDLTSALSKVNKSTPLYEFFGGFIFVSDRTDADGTTYSATMVISDRNVLAEYLDNIDSRYGWYSAELRFMYNIDSSSGYIETTGQLIDYINSYYIDDYMSYGYDRAVAE